MKRKVAALVLCLLMVVQLSAPAAAARSVYFLAVNNNVLPMSDATMPFWSGGVMYIPSSIFTGAVRKEVDVGFVYNPERQLLILYNSAKQRLEFDMSRNYVGDSEGNIYYRRALLRGSEVFVPAVLVADYFGLVYSTTAVTANVAGNDEAWMVWLRDKNWTLPEKSFADAAGSMMRDRYEAYNRKQEPADQPVQPPADETPITGKQLYLCFLADSAGQVESLLDALERTDSQATFCCTEDFLQEEGALLRRMSAMGHAIALLADAQEGEGSVTEQLSRGNEALYRATCGKTRLAYLVGADADAEAEAAAAGYCRVAPRLDHTAYGLRSSSGVSVLIQRATTRQGDVSVWLGDNVTAVGLREFLADVSRADNRCLSLAEPIL